MSQQRVIAAAEVMLMMMFKHYIPLSPKLTI